ncbi:unnamed protein product [Brassica rapa subsp. narinosa]
MFWPLNSLDPICNRASTMFSDSPPPTDPDSPQPETRPESNPSSPHFTAATNPGIRIIRTRFHIPLTIQLPGRTHTRPRLPPRALNPRLMGSDPRQNLPNQSPLPPRQASRASHLSNLPSHGSNKAPPLRRSLPRAHRIARFRRRGAHYRYESHPEIYPNRKGSLVPFALRWLHALIPTRIGNRLEWLYTLLDFVRGRIREKGDDCSVELCKKRERFVMSCLLGFHLGHKEFGVSLELIKELIKRDPLDHVLVSKLGYVQMQFGDVEGAKATFNRIEKSNENLVGRNKALVHVVAKDYAAAVREYEECIERDSSDVVAVNNKALC